MRGTEWPGECEPWVFELIGWDLPGLRNRKRQLRKLRPHAAPGPRTRRLG